jgi:hypothetical protein
VCSTPDRDGHPIVVDEWTLTLLTERDVPPDQCALLRLQVEQVLRQTARRLSRTLEPDATVRLDPASVR